MTPKGKAKKVVSQTEEFFFAGGTEYKSKTIKANSLSEATEIWEQTKEKIN